MLKSYKILVKGKVQGVWFRKYTKKQANFLHLNGFVRNEPNGDVYIEVEGKSEPLNEFIEWLYKGSPLSKVTDLEIKPSDLKQYKSFEIRW